MANKKRKTLPADFGAMLEGASLDELKAVFDACALEATGGYGKTTALGFYQCPDALAAWLVEQGADINAGDKYKRTPLHHRSASWKGGVDALLDLGADIEARDYQGQTPLHAAANSHKPDAIRALVRRGAQVVAVDQRGQTPLKLALVTASNIDIVTTAAIAEHLLASGAALTDDMREDVARIGKTFEFHRSGFNPDEVDATSAGLDALYRIFGAAPVPARRVHDGVSPIVVAAGDWPAQHQALWELLVPSSGAAATVQGEVIRITGRVAREVLDNGGANWSADYRAMLTALVAHLGSGTSLLPDDLSAAAESAATLRSGRDDDAPERLCELAVRWVVANPQPVALATPPYRI